MAARLPTRDNLGGLPSARSGRALLRVDVPDVGAGVARGAMSAIDAAQRGLASVGNSINRAATTIQEHDEQQQKYDTELRFQEYVWGQQKALEERARGIQPGQARDFANTWQGDYLNSTKEFFKTVPANLRGEYENKLFRAEREMFSSAATFGRTEQKRFATEGIGKATENIFAPRARTTSTEKLGEITSDYDRLIDSNPDLTPIEAAELKRKGRASIAAAHLDGQSPDRVVALLSGSGPVDGGSVVDRIIGVESGGKANAKNPMSSAYGAGQFINSTWLSLIKETKPELAAGRSDAELLALRGDPNLSREMVKAYADKNSAFLQAQGLQPSPANVYLAHFLGPAGAAKVLKAGADTPVSDILPKDVIDANRGILAGKTAGSVQAWAGEKMGGVSGGEGTVFDALSYEAKDKLIKTAQLKQTQNQTQAAAVRNEELERSIIDASSKPNAVLPARTVIESEPLISEAQRNTLLRQYDAAAKDAVKLQTGLAKFADPKAGPFNPYSTDDKDVIDKIYKNFGGSQNPAALAAVVQRTNMIPKSAALELRGALASGDEKRVGEALQTLSNLRQRADVFEGVDGQKDLEETADQFRHYVDDRGMTAEDATRRIILNRDPEHKAKIAARVKNENVDEMIKKKLSISDLKGAFDPSFLGLARNPSIGFNPDQRDGMFKDYAELVKDRYMEAGDWDEATSYAANTLKKVWGETRINGQKVIMRYPPEQAPGMAGIENRSDAIAGQALADIKVATGKDIPRDKIFLTAIPGLTAQAFKSGKPTPYQLSWFDQNGTLQTLNPGKAWVADPTAAKAAQSEQRRAALGAGREEFERSMARVDQRKSNLRAIREASRERNVADERQVELNLADY